MGKTFEEWFEEVYDGRWGRGSLIFNVMKESWEASRQNMTTKDIQYVYDLLRMGNWGRTDSAFF